MEAYLNLTPLRKNRDRFVFGHRSLTWNGKVQYEGYLIAAKLGLDHSEAHRPARLPDFRLARLPRSVGVRHRVRLVFVGAVVDGAVMAVNEGGDVAEKKGSKTWRNTNTKSE